jgi:phytoene dehydrogenase-like protein
LPEGTASAAGVEGGDYLWRVNDHGRTIRELRRWSLNDAEAYEEYGQLMVDMARFIKPILSITPPDLTSLDPRPMLPLAGLARRFQRLTERQQAAFVGLMTMSAVDFLDQWFETDPLKATMSASGIIGTYLGIRSPGTAYVLLHHYMGEIDGAFRAWGIPKGGTGGISTAIASAAQVHGAEIRTEAPVGRILVRRGRAVGVALEDGEEIAADVVLSSVDSRVTFLGLLEPGTLDPSFEEEVRRFKFRGSSGKVNLAVDRLPDFSCLPGPGEHLRGAISFSPTVDEMEQAYDDAKYGRWSRKPYIDMIIPTLVDPSMAPPGKHVISCFVQYAPYKLDPALGSWDDNREAFGDTVIDRIAEFAPNIRDIIVDRQVLTPLDIERRFGLTEGNIFQGELSLEQLFFSRPVPGWARYRTPVRDLWLCGSSTHPGGGIMGANGRIAALQVLRARSIGRRVA